MPVTRYLLKEKWLHITLLLLVASGIRLAKLDQFDLWYDEGVSIYEVTNWPYTFPLHVHVHPFGFHLLLRIWMLFFSSPFGLRLLPFLFAIASIGVTYKFTERLYDHGTAMLAAFILTFAPMHFYYSRELRSYSLFALMGIVVWLIMLGLEQSVTRKKLIWFSLSWILLLYTHYFAVFILVSQFLFILVLDLEKKLKRKLFVALSISTVVFVFWLPRLIFIANRFLNYGDYFAPPVSWKTPYQLLRFYVAGYEPPEFIGNIIALLTIGCLSIALFTNSRKQNKYLIGMGLIPLLAAVVPGMIMEYKMIIARYMIFLMMPAAVFAAAGIRKMRIYLGTVMLLCLLSMQLVSLSYQHRNLYCGMQWGHGVRAREEWSAAAELIAMNWRSDDVIGHACNNSIFPFYYYLTLKHGIDPGRLIDVDHAYEKFILKTFSIPKIWNEYELVIPVELDRMIESRKRLWFVGSEWDIGSDTFGSNFRQKVQSILIKRYPVLLHREFFGAPVYLFDLEHPVSEAGPEYTDKSLT